MNSVIQFLLCYKHPYHHNNTLLHYIPKITILSGTSIYKNIP